MTLEELCQFVLDGFRNCIMLSLKRGIIPVQKEKKRDLPGTEQPYIV